MKLSPIRLRPLNWKLLLCAPLILLVSAPFARLHAAEPGSVEVQDQTAAPPHLIFACDGSASDLEKLLTPQLIADLKILNAGVAISTEDFSPERAEIVRRLNAAGVPATAWILLPPDQGFYSNADNAPETLSRFNEFDTWTTKNNLRWAAVGFDIEPNFSQFAALKDHKMQLLGLLLRRAFDSARVRNAQDAYSQIIRQMQARGYVVQTYQLPFIADERKAHSTVLERELGLVDVRGNDEVLMLYPSFNQRIGSALIWKYGPNAQTIAVGITSSSGDAATDAAFPPLNWDEFSNALIVARHFSATVAVYNLRGAIQQGFIARLKTMDWTQPAYISADSIARATRLRRVVRVVLWVGSNLIYLAAAGIVIIACLAFAIAHRRKRKRAQNMRADYGPPPRPI